MRKKLIPLLCSLSLAFAPTLVCAQTPPAPIPEKMGQVFLESVEPGTPLFLDGVPVGVAPLPGPWTLPVGDHTLELRPADGPVETLSFTAVAGQEVVLKSKRPPKATSVIEIAPQGPLVRHEGPGFSLATAGYVSAGVGLATLGLGAFFGLSANKAADDANAYDRASPDHTRAGLNELIDQADRDAFLANLSFGVGAVALLTGAALVVVAHDGPFGGFSLFPTAGGVGVGGAF